MCESEVKWEMLVNFFPSFCEIVSLCIVLRPAKEYFAHVRNSTSPLPEKGWKLDGAYGFDKGVIVHVLFIVPYLVWQGISIITVSPKVPTRLVRSNHKPWVLRNITDLEPQRE